MFIKASIITHVFDTLILLSDSRKYMCTAKTVDHRCIHTDRD